MKNVFLFNLIEFIRKEEKEVTLDKSKGKRFLGELTEDFSTRYLWLKFLDVMSFDNRTKRLFQYIKDSLEKEDYSRTHMLHNELLRTIGVTDDQLADIAYKMLHKLAKSVDQYSRFRYLIKDVNRMFFIYEFEDDNRYMSIFEEIEMVEFELALKVDSTSDQYNHEIGQMVNRDLVPHPYIFISQIKFFFSFLCKQHEVELAETG